MLRLNFAVITVSDSCYKGEKNNESGPKLVELLKAKYPDCTIIESLVADEVSMIKEKLLGYCNIECDVIFTSGGTGFASRDVTPEATRAVIEKEAPGISYAMFNKSLAITPYAMLSRAVCGIRNKSLIINLPGSTKAVVEHFQVIQDVIPHAVSLIKDIKLEILQTHQRLQDTFKKTDFTPSKVKCSVANRSRSSPYNMIEVSAAHEIIKNTCVQSSDIEEININDSLGRVLVDDVRSYDNLPPFPSSIKDGYAVRSCDETTHRVVLDVVAAGDMPGEFVIEDGQCVRISTGAPVPIGADAVIQVEDTILTKASNDGEKELEIEMIKLPSKGNDIRPVGSDIEAHTVIMKKRMVINSAEIGILAAVGRTTVNVFKRPSIGIISTGNELQDYAEPLKHGHIRDTNKITLINVLKQYGYEGKDFGLAKDEPDAVKLLLEQAFSQCDLVITTGGVSMSEYDVIKSVLQVDFDAKIHFGRVNMKPGKPTTFATCAYRGNIKMIFGLPGNPVSATVTCLLFVIPTLRYCENRENILFPMVHVTKFNCPKIDLERPEYHRVKLAYGLDITAETTGNQISSRLNSFVGADGLLLVPPKREKSVAEIFAVKQKSSNVEHRTQYNCYVLTKF